MTGVPLAALAPRNDFTLHERLSGSSTINNVIVKAPLAVMTVHLWYLSEELVILLLFDIQRSVHMKEIILAVKERVGSGEKSPTKCPTILSAVSDRNLKGFAMSNT